MGVSFHACSLPRTRVSSCFWSYRFLASECHYLYFYSGCFRIVFEITITEVDAGMHGNVRSVVMTQKLTTRNYAVHFLQFCVFCSIAVSKASNCRYLVFSFAVYTGRSYLWTILITRNRRSDLPDPSSAVNDTVQWVRFFDRKVPHTIFLTPNVVLEQTMSRLNFSISIIPFISIAADQSKSKKKR